jgi:dTDP-4-amino-4,6-dideoxygalactose transaminase
MPSLSFIASANPIRYLGAEPVFVDSDPTTLSMDPTHTLARLEEMVSGGIPPKAVLAVHLYGNSADLDPILKRCKELDIPVLEDATEALGGNYRGRPPGTLGDLGCFSFNDNKIITSGSGGMIVTDNQDLAQRILYLSTQAKDDPVRYLHGEVGYNYRMTALQAALGTAQLAHLEEFLEQKRAIARRYREGLGDLPGLTLAPAPDCCQPTYWNYCVLVDPAQTGITAGEMVESLRIQGIECRPFFPPIHTQKPYRDVPVEDLPGASYLWERGLVIPCGTKLTMEQQGRVVAALRQVLAASS